MKMNREEVIKELELLREIIRTANSTTFVSASKKVMCMHYIEYAIELLKSSFTPKEVYETVIEHVQHDKKFKLGDTFDYTFIEVVDILNTELMCKAGDM